MSSCGRGRVGLTRPRSTLVSACNTIMHSVGNLTPNGDALGEQNLAPQGLERVATAQTVHHTDQTVQALGVGVGDGVLEVVDDERQLKPLRELARRATSGRSRTSFTASTSVFFSSVVSVFKSPSLK